MWVCVCVVWACVTHARARGRHPAAGGCSHSLALDVDSRGP